jgi:hypothetical protein
MSTWYFLVALAAFGILGMIGHVLRAVINLYPDRLSDKPLLDVVVSPGYSIEDHLFQLEFDEYGFYRLDSRRNLIITTILTMFGGLIIILLDASIANQISGLIDLAWAWIGETAQKRLTEFGLRS